MTIKLRLQAAIAAAVVAVFVLLSFPASAQAASAAATFGYFPGQQTGPVTNIYARGGFQVTSADGGTYAVFQTDGNLVVYRATGTVIWSAGTNNHGFTLRLQGDGNIVIYDSVDQPVWASGTDGHGYNGFQLLMQNDQNLVLYDFTGGQHALWSTRTGRL